MTHIPFQFRNWDPGFHIWHRPDGNLPRDAENPGLANDRGKILSQRILINGTLVLELSGTESMIFFKPLRETCLVESSPSASLPQLSHHKLTDPAEPSHQELEEELRDPMRAPATIVSGDGVHYCWLCGGREFDFYSPHVAGRSPDLMPTGTTPGEWARPLSMSPRKSREVLVPRILGTTMMLDPQNSQFLNRRTLITTGGSSRYRAALSVVAMSQCAQHGYSRGPERSLHVFWMEYKRKSRKPPSWDHRSEEHSHTPSFQFWRPHLRSDDARQSQDFEEGQEL
ncbi:hypothetical protein FB451DRAFT_1179736 [Mycena latifolia]|nr:hypothetical protein FB451DRAFT_1179736 [Mycena latifolia]